jgi:hypothetical protein
MSFSQFCKLNMKWPESGVARFFWSKHTKTGKEYQMTTNYTELLQSIPNGRNIIQIAIKSFKHFPLQGSPKFWNGNKPSGNPASVCMWVQ